MKKQISARELVLLAVLVLLVIGVAYYLLFYQPLQGELSSIRNQCAELDTQLSTTVVLVKKMNDMQDELDAIHAQPVGEVTEVAPFDNSNVIMAELNGVLSKSDEYKLSFSDPKSGEDGIVRRPVSMTFRCASYQAAKNILVQLNGTHFIAAEGPDDFNRVLGVFLNE